MKRDSGRRPVVDEPQAELEGSSLVSALATLGISVAACVLAVLPALVALRSLAWPLEWVRAGLGCLGAAAGGVKLIAMAWAVGGRLPVAHRPAIAVAAAG